MKKIFSAILAVAMVASTMVTAFANTTLNATLTNNKNGKTLKAGDTINVTVTLTDAEFANFEFGLNYDADAFTYVKGAKASSSNLDGAVVFGNPATGYVTGVYANAQDETLVVEIEDEESGEVTEVAAKNTFYWQFKVNEGAYTGSYEFTLVQNDEQKRGTSSIANGALTTVLGAPTTATVEGVDPAPSYTAATCAIEYTDVNAEAAYTKGIKGTITPNDDAVKGVNFTLKNTANENTKLVDWTFDTEKISGLSQIVFGLNVINVPANVDVTIDGDVTILK